VSEGKKKDANAPPAHLAKEKRKRGRGDGVKNMCFSMAHNISGGGKKGGGGASADVQKKKRKKEKRGSCSSAATFFLFPFRSIKSEGRQSRERGRRP